MISVLVPWSPAAAESGPERDASWSWNRRRLRGLLGEEVEIVLGAPDVVGDPAIFSRSLALNRAAAVARGDIFLIVDADTTCSAEDFAAVIDRAEHGAYTLPLRYVRLSARASAEWLLREPTAPPPDDWERDLDQEYPFANSGVVAMPREAFELAGGFDERFKGWGGEDDAMRAVFETLWRTPERIGIAYHLWHPRPPEHSSKAPYTAESFVLADRYGAASGDREAILALLAEGR